MCVYVYLCMCECVYICIYAYRNTKEVSGFYLTKQTDTWPHPAWAQAVRHGFVQVVPPRATGCSCAGLNPDPKPWKRFTLNPKP